MGLEFAHSPVTCSFHSGRVLAGSYAGGVSEFGGFCVVEDKGEYNLSGVVSGRITGIMLGQVSGAALEINFVAWLGCQGSIRVHQMLATAAFWSTCWSTSVA
jgi:hypothetical protein